MGSWLHLVLISKIIRFKNPVTAFAITGFFYTVVLVFMINGGIQISSVPPIKIIS